MKNDSIEIEYNIVFDLSVLLSLDCIDIKKTAKNNPSLQLWEYFYLLEQFIEYGDDFAGNLKKISEQKANEDDFQNIAGMKAKLATINIGRENFLETIDEIVKHSKKSHAALAGDLAKTLHDDFMYLYNMIKSAKREELKIDVPLSKETQFLSKVINVLIYEEANRKMRILIVDDAPSMIKTVSAVLENDYQIYGLSDPRMTEKFLHQIRPELFLLDYEMPVLNGFDLIPVIRSFKEHKDTPIIFLTALGTMDNVSAAYVLGACDFIVKPFQSAVLREKIKKHIVRKKLF